MPRRAARPAALAVAAALLAAGIPATANAGTTTTPDPSLNTVDIHNCAVKRSRNAGGFTWFSCYLTWSMAPGSSGSVTYTSNLASFTPNKNQAGSDWSKSTGTMQLGSGDLTQGIKIAVKNRKMTPAQVKSKLKVTLSNPQDVTIGDGTATAAAAGS